MENIQHYKDLLMAEHKELEKSLAGHGKVIDKKGEDWTATPGTFDEDEEDHTVRADMMDTLQTNIAAVDVLEARLVAVTAALARIEDGSYGTCGDHAISADRLAANPAATTCAEHMEDK